MELLSPAGNMEKLKTALHFGADAVYLAGKRFSLRAAADNFDNDELIAAVKEVHGQGKRVYVALNIIARDSDFDGLQDYIKFLYSVGADAVIVSDLGIISVIKRAAPALEIHLSTQANVTNKYAARFFADIGVKRIVLARELSLPEIRQIRDFLPPEVELEAFAHGAMCISYSGRCLLSDFMTGRNSNRGQCAQSCRWEYAVTEKVRGEYMPIEQDERGTYIFNSKDLNAIELIPQLAAAGVDSLKIEGRVKSSYYVASVTNAYRRALDIYKNGGEYVLPQSVTDCLLKTSHRLFTTGFLTGGKGEQCYETSKPRCDYDFTALVLEKKEDGVLVEMRGRFKTGDVLEALSAGEDDDKEFTVGVLKDEKGETVTDAFKVQQRLFLQTSLNLSAGDMLRKRAKT